MLLHGFPSYWETWREQLQPLVDSGHQVIAPDLRGYNLSDKPSGVEAYKMFHVAADIQGLLKALGHERAAVVGHDWGAVVAWAVAMRFPEMVERLVVMNVTHPRLTKREMRKPSRMLKWWYMFLFQLPWLPEALMTTRHSIKQCLQSIAARPEVFSAQDVERHLQAIRQPGAATATINYYRAMFRFSGQGLALRDPVQPPTLVIWGQQDPILGEELLDGLEDTCRDVRVERIEGAGHWVHLECPAEVNRLLLRFLS